MASKRQPQSPALSKPLTAQSGSKATRAASSSGDAAPRDLVHATMTVTAPPKDRLTGGDAALSVTGKNTGWAKAPLPAGGAGVPKYQARRTYMQDNHANHPLAKKLMDRHVQQAPAEDKRGLSCAEGHSLMVAHQELSQRGNTHAAAQMDAFTASLVPVVPAYVPAALPTFGNNTRNARKNLLMSNYRAAEAPRIAAHGALVQQRQATLDSLAKSMTGMDSWHDYAAKESSFMAWNDIQQHGALSNVHHHESSEVSAGHAMDYCVQCRAEVAGSLKHK
ncbi:hypothetical protein [Polaromonas aquatica]|uniref:hypothetical protein n=1 Tax=Polaromonas aquatica TaxID=332657 RepID=UPI003D649775